MFEMYIQSFERVWQNASPAWQHDEDEPGQPTEVAEVTAVAAPALAARGPGTASTRDSES